MTKINHGTDTRPDGYYRVKYEGTWIIAHYEKTAYGRGLWAVPGVQGDKVENELDQIDENIIDAHPVEKCKHIDTQCVYDREGEYIGYTICLDCEKIINQ
jgi:hypothetical protein